jgi:hypothetical protein
MKRAAIGMAGFAGLALRYWRLSLLGIAGLAAAAFLALMLTTPWDSAGQAGAQQDFFITHSAKFLCGSVTTSDGPVVPGDYQTAINVHNFTAGSVGFYKKAVEALEESLIQPEPSTWVTASLGPDEAFEIDCAEIIEWLYPQGGAPAFLKGYVVISYEGAAPVLDVVGVYFNYSAKFVCGTVAAGEVAAVVPGDYETAINVHNPWEDVGDYIELYKKAVWAQPETETPEPPSSWEFYTVQPNHAFEIDCNEIADWLFPAGPPAFYKGFVVISSPNELDVVGVYTSERIETEGKGFALDIEEVPHTIQPAPVVD